MKQKILIVVAALAAQFLIAQGAQAFPERPVRLVVPSGPGGPPDIVARLISDKMAANLGQPVIVDNRPGGAGGTVGSRSVLSAEPDGYTILMGSTSSLLIAPLIHKNVGYTASTFTPISRVLDTSELLAVHPSVAANSVAELVSLAKSKPGALNFASAGVGTLPHIEGELLKARAQIDIHHVPYRGGGPGLTGLLGGEVQMFFSAVTQMLPYAKEGRLRALAVTSATRSKLAPEIPTMVESGFDQFIMTSITAIVAPPNTPLAIRKRLSEAIGASLASDDVQRSMARMGAEPRATTPEDLAAYLASEQQRWARIIETTKISVD